SMALATLPARESAQAVPPLAAAPRCDVARIFSPPTTQMTRQNRKRHLVSVRLLRGMLLLIPVEFLPPLIAEEVILIEEHDRPAHDHEVLRILERLGLVVDHADRLVEVIPGDQFGVTHPEAALQHEDMGVAEVLVPWRNRALQRAYEHRYPTGFRADPKYLHEVPIGIEA